MSCRRCSSAATLSAKRFYICQQYTFVIITITIFSSLLSTSFVRRGRCAASATAFIPQTFCSTTTRSLKVPPGEQQQQQVRVTSLAESRRGLLVPFVIRRGSSSSSSTTTAVTASDESSSFGWRDMMNGMGQSTVDASYSSSLPFEQKKNSNTLLVVCPKCHGEGLLRKPPSRKARLRHKRHQQQQQQPLQFHADAAHERPSSSMAFLATNVHDINDEPSEYGDNDNNKNKEPQHHRPPQRIDPCPHCYASGLVPIIQLDSSTTVDETTTMIKNHNDEKQTTTTITTKSQHQQGQQQLSLPTVAIIGGGLAGLAMAIACGHRGIPATVYERDLNFGQRRQGYGLTLQQASKALASLGITSAASSTTTSTTDSSSSTAAVAANANTDNDRVDTLIARPADGSRDWITSTRHLVHKPDGTVVGEWGLRKWKQQPTSSLSSSSTTTSEQVEEQEQAESMTCTQRQQVKQQGRGRRQNVHIARQALRYQLLMAAYDAARSFALQNASAASSCMSNTCRDEYHDDDTTTTTTTTTTVAMPEPNDGRIDVAASPAVVQWNQKFMQYTKTESGRLELVFQVSDDGNAGDGNNTQQVRVEADLLVGADGIRSQVRRQLYGERNEAAPLRYLNCLVILGICPLSSINIPPSSNEKEQEKNENHHISKHFLLDGHTVFQTADGTTRIYVMPYSETECMWQLSFPMPNEDEAMSLSVNGGPAALLQQALERCQTWHVPIPQILMATPVSLVSGYPVYDRQPLETLDHPSSNTDCQREEGQRRVTLIGDACHPMSPFKGQGANQALLDALSLANSIYTTYVNADKKKKSKKDKHHNNMQSEEEEEANISCNYDELLKEALLRFENEMISRSKIKVEASAEAAQFLHSDIAIQEGDVTRGAAAAAAAAVKKKKRRTTNDDNNET